MEVGIDFGTTFSTLCFSPGKGVDGCVRESDTIYIPTIVGVRPDGTYTVGLGALQEEGLLLYRDIKRYFGMNVFNKDEFLAKLSPSFEVIVDGWGASIGPTNGEKGKTKSVISLACLFVSALTSLAVRMCGENISVSVCSVPAEYNTYMRGFIFKSCSLANISVQAVVNEPTAAGLSAFVTVDKNDVKYMLVYDFGGGTFDASLLAVGPAYVCVLDSLGDNYLGGRDVDKALANLVSSRLSLQPGSIDSFSMEALKIDIVDNPKATLRRVLTGAGTIFDVPISEHDFRNLCKPLVERAKSIVQNLLRRNDVSSCVAVLIGGSSVLPGVVNSVAELKGIRQVLFDKNTYRAAVAIGAAIYAQTFSGTSRYRLIDCISNSLSDERQPLRAITVFPKGHPIPSSVSVKFKMPSHDTGVVLHEGESSFINMNARTFSASVKREAFRQGVEYLQVFNISEDGRLTVKMGDVVLRNLVEPKEPPTSEYNLRYLSSDDKRIKPEVSYVKLFYSKLFGDSTLPSKSTAERKQLYSTHGLVVDF
uniref:HSP70h n=1 Tax=Grapevine leafroll-associated virus Carn TaxID=659661 RepID=D2E4A9_9VIRU|nr:HSP70h [Grapevine leafroll-associated virus Carn]